MAAASPADYLKLGIHLEYLRGLSSNFGLWDNRLDRFSHLRENQPAMRFSAANVVAVVKSLLAKLASLQLEQSLKDADEFRPMLAEIEEYLRQSPVRQSAFLQDHFADALVRIADKVLAAVTEEIETKHR